MPNRETKDQIKLVNKLQQKLKRCDSNIQYIKCKRLFEQILLLKSNDKIQVYIAYANLLKQHNQIKLALSILERIVSAYPGNHDLMVKYFDCLDVACDYRKIKEIITQLIDFQTVVPEKLIKYCRGYAKACYNLHQFQEGLNLMHQLESHPKTKQLAKQDQVFLRGKMILSQEVGKYDQALACSMKLEKFMKQDGDGIDALLASRCHVLLVLCRYEELFNLCNNIFKKKGTKKAHGFQAIIFKLTCYWKKGLMQQLKGSLDSAFKIETMGIIFDLYLVILAIITAQSSLLDPKYDYLSQKINEIMKKLNLIRTNQQYRCEQISKIFRGFDYFVGFRKCLKFFVDNFKKIDQQPLIKHYGEILLQCTYVGSRVRQHKYQIMKQMQPQILKSLSQ